MRERSELRVVADQQGSPTAAPDLADAIAGVLARIRATGWQHDHRGVFHAVAQGFTTWHAFAQAIFDAATPLGGPTPDVQPITTADYPTRAARPADGRLDTTRLAQDLRRDAAKLGTGAGQGGQGGDGIVRPARPWLAALLVVLLPGCGMAQESPACPPVAVPPIAAPGFAAAVARGGEVRIVALGSSSTAGAGASLPWRAYPARLESRLRADLPGPAYTVMNRGAGGEDAAHMLGRLERDAIAERPHLVIWQVGANAALRSMDRDSFRSFLRQGLLRLRTAGIDVVLMDNQRAPRITARPGHQAYDAMLAEAAAEVPGVVLFSRGALMDAWAAAGVANDALLISDNLHHNDRGYACIAEALSAALVAGLPSQQTTTRR